jgi:hypothetical protein
VKYNFNSKCPKCLIHGGFLTAFNTSKSTIIAATQFWMAYNKNDKLVIAGGSLGGALAALAFAEMKSNSANGLNPVRGITFGQPRVGNPDWAKYMNNLTDAFNSNRGTWLRVTHGYGKLKSYTSIGIHVLRTLDPVPRGPPPTSGLDTYLQHSPETWAIDETTTHRPDASSTYLCHIGSNGEEDSNCVDSGLPPLNIGDHVTYPGYGSEAAVC